MQIGVNKNMYCNCSLHLVMPDIVVPLRPLKRDCGSLAQWLLKLGTRDPRLDSFHCCSIWYFMIPGQDTIINKEQLFSTIWKYCLWYNAITKLHIHCIYYIGLNGRVLFLTISLLKMRWPPNCILFLW